MGLLTVRDEWSKLIGHRFLNSQICLWLGMIQLTICIWAIAQHVYSFLKYDKVMHCDFSDGFHWFIGVDAIIFDVGLLHSLWGINGCVAEYMDGGFGRLGWCISHAITLLISLPFACSQHPKPHHLWPLLIQQSAYGIGLLILSLSTLPRVLPIFMEAQGAPILPLVIYLIGTTINFFLLYVYWHWYWYVDSMWNSIVKIPFGSRLENANNRSRRDAPRHDPEGPPVEDLICERVQECEREVEKKRERESVQEEENTFHREAPNVPPRCISPSSMSTQSEILPAIWPPPPIVATRVHGDSRENRRLRIKEERQRQLTRMQRNEGRQPRLQSNSIEQDELNGNFTLRSIDHNLNPYSINLEENGEYLEVQYPSTSRLRFETQPQRCERQREKRETRETTDYRLQNGGSRVYSTRAMVHDSPRCDTSLLNGTVKRGIDDGEMRENRQRTTREHSNTRDGSCTRTPTKRDMEQGNHLSRTRYNGSTKVLRHQTRICDDDPIDNCPLINGESINIPRMISTTPKRRPVFTLPNTDV